MFGFSWFSVSSLFYIFHLTSLFVLMIVYCVCVRVCVFLHLHLIEFSCRLIIIMVANTSVNGVLLIFIFLSSVSFFLSSRIILFSPPPILTVATASVVARVVWWIIVTPVTSSVTTCNNRQLFFKAVLSFLGTIKRTKRDKLCKRLCLFRSKIWGRKKERQLVGCGADVPKDQVSGTPVYHLGNGGQQK